MNLIQKFKNPQFILGTICFIVVVLVSLSSAFHAPKTFEDGGIEYTMYNNYVK